MICPACGLLVASPLTRQGTDACLGRWQRGRIDRFVGLAGWRRAATNLDDPAICRGVEDAHRRISSAAIAALGRQWIDYRPWLDKLSTHRRSNGLEEGHGTLLATQPVHCPAPRHAGPSLLWRHEPGSAL